MATPLMTPDQQSDAALWRLPRGRSMRLSVGPGERRLRVHTGRLWLTAQGDLDRPAEDVWLAAGEDVRLPSGTSIVAEGWPQASFELVVPPQDCTTANPVSRWLSGRAA